MSQACFVFAVIIGVTVGELNLRSSSSPLHVRLRIHRMPSLFIYCSTILLVSSLTYESKEVWLTLKTQFCAVCKFIILNTSTKRSKKAPMIERRIMRSRNRNRQRDLITSISMLSLLLLTILVISPDVNGFVPSAASSSRVPAFATPISRSAKLPLLFGSSIGEATGGEGNASTPIDMKEKKPTRNPVKMAYRIYTGYATRLWRETDPSERSRIADDKVAQTIRDMQHVLTSEHETINSSSSDKKCVDASEQLLKACEHMLLTLEEDAKSKKETAEGSTAVASVDANTEKSKSPPAKKEKKQRSILFGALMGVAVAAWVFSGNYIFTGLFCLVTILGQLEYYRMVMNTGVFPARVISVIGATSMFVTVCFIAFVRMISIGTSFTSLL